MPRPSASSPSLCSVLDRWFRSKRRASRRPERPKPFESCPRPLCKGASFGVRSLRAACSASLEVESECSLTPAVAPARPFGVARAETPSQTSTHQRRGRASARVPSTGFALRACARSARPASAIVIVLRSASTTALWRSFEPPSRERRLRHVSPPSASLARNRRSREPPPHARTAGLRRACLACVECGVPQRSLEGPGTRFHAAPGELLRASTTLCVPEGGKPLLPRSFRLLDTSRREDPGQRAWSLLAAGAFEESPFAPAERRALGRFHAFSNPAQEHRCSKRYPLREPLARAAPRRETRAFDPRCLPLVSPVSRSVIHSLSPECG